MKERHRDRVQRKRNQRLEHKREKARFIEFKERGICCCLGVRERKKVQVRGREEDEEKRERRR